MAGHSKWANIKHRKDRQDAKKGKAFSQASKLITIAAKKGGDPKMNPNLALAIEKAKQVNMPKANIEKAIKKGTGELTGGEISQEKIEAYGPGGISLIIQMMTDNKNRTFSEVRQIITEAGGKTADSGSVSWKFEKKGQVIIQAKVNDEILEKIIESGARDYQEIDDGLIVYSEPSQLHQIKKQLEEKGLKVAEAELILKPKDTLEITEKDQANKIIKLIEDLEDHEDVENVATDFEIAE